MNDVVKQFNNTYMKYYIKIELNPNIYGTYVGSIYERSTGLGPDTPVYSTVVYASPTGAFEACYRAYLSKFKKEN